MSRTLVLTNSYQPHKIVSWERAITLLFQKKAEVVEEYEEEVYRSMTLVIKMPAVVRLLRAVRGSKHGVKFSRINVMTRDKMTCQYCGSKKAMDDLNYDHVVPRSQGGKTTWDNVVVACYPCNGRKANRTPAQAGMKLLSTPGRPKSLPIAMFRVDLKSIPDAWASWVYWQGALEEEV